MIKRNVVIGLLGTRLDRAEGPGRWEVWRPTVALTQHEELVIDRLELLHERAFLPLAQQVREDITAVSPDTEVRLVEVDFDGDPWDFESVYAALHDFAGGHAWDEEHEDYLIHITTGTHVAQICLFLLLESGHLSGRLLQTAPPPEPRAGRRTRLVPTRWQVIDLDLSKYDRLATRFVVEQGQALDVLKAGIATRNPTFNRMIERIEQVALRSREPMLLTGPTGSGKSHLARQIHALRLDRGLVRGGFIEVNCATLRGDTAGSALFGHVRGAFTGAQRDRPGLLRSADGGVLFLDEIGELGGDEQAMLLRALEEKTFLPVGSDRPVSSDFLLIAGTNRDLGHEIVAGRFREDLFARLNTWTFDLPSLAQRREDIEPNLDHELARLADRLTPEPRRGRGRGGRRQVGMNREARAAFLRFALHPDTPWSGNFRDLNAAVLRMATLAPRGRIGVAEVEEECQRLRVLWRRPGAPAGQDGRPGSAPDGEGGVGLPTTPAAEMEPLTGGRWARLDSFDQAQLSHVVAVCRRSQTLSEAGRRLFARSREGKARPNDADRLRKYLARFGLEFAQLRPGAGS